MLPSYKKGIVRLSIALCLLFAAVLGVHAFTQEFYMREEGAGCRILDQDVDWSGQHYLLKRNASDTLSTIYQNYSPNNKTPFITIDGKVTGISVTSDKDASYVYYKKKDEKGIYRLPLIKGANAGQAVYKEFSFDDSVFDFASFTLADNPDQFLLSSKHDDALQVKIGLFSFTGGTEPLRTWTATLPQAWKDTFVPIETGDLGYGIRFEASTGKVWFAAQKTYYPSSGGYFNAYHWYFSKKITESGELMPYSPAEEVPGWSEGNFKTLNIGRYARIVYEFEGDQPGTFLSFREFDPVKKELKQEAITEWTGSDGKVYPIDDFYDSSGEWGVEFFYYGMYADGQKNFYATYYAHPNVFQRFARFKPESAGTSGIEQPQPDPSADGVTFPDPSKVVLKASAAKLPTGYAAEGSRWEIYRVDGGSETRVYNGQNTGPNNTHTVAMTLPKGQYRWRMAYDWVYSGSSETMRGATNWSNPASIGVEENNTDPGDDKKSSDSSSGGCDAASATYAILLLAPLALMRKKD